MVEAMEEKIKAVLRAFMLDIEMELDGMQEESLALALYPDQILDLLKRGGWVHLDSWLDKPNFSWGYEPMCNLKNDNCPFTMILVGQYCDTLSAACDHREYRKHTRRQVLAGEGERV